MILEDYVKLKASLVKDEGSSLKLYLDPLGVPTIGIGHNLKTNALSQHIVDLIFEADVNAALMQLTKLHSWATLDSVRQAVILNMAFQLGVAGVMSFRKMCTAIAPNDYTTAPMNF